MNQQESGFVESYGLTAHKIEDLVDRWECLTSVMQEFYKEDLVLQLTERQQFVGSAHVLEAIAAFDERMLQNAQGARDIMGVDVLSFLKGDR
jgi:hypothetical protein